MFKRVFALMLALSAGTTLWAQEDDWDVEEPTPAVVQEPAPVVEQNSAPAPSEIPAASTNSAAPTASATPVASAEPASTEPAPAESREVPVRYWVAGEPEEQEAIFVKIEKDTVYLKRPNEAEQKKLEKIADEQNATLQETNGQQVEEDAEDTEETPAPVAEVIMTDEVKKAAEASQESPAEPAVETPPEDDGADDDFETALAKEDTRLKLEEIAKVEEEIRQREIQDSIAADSANPFMKYFRLDLKRLYNLEDEEMIDLSLSNYVVPVEVEEEEEELYPPGNANLLVRSSPAACSLYVNGIPIHQLAPDTIKNIKPGKYTISVMQVLKDVEWWGSAVVKINADSLNKVEIPVLRPATRLTLNTDPEAVEVYIDEEPNVDEMPHYMTDIIVDDIRPQPQVSIYLRKIGYRDTTIVTEIKSFMPNLINVEMEPVLDDLDFIEEQNAFNEERSKRRVGRGLLWSSIAPFVAAGVMWYLAERDWSDAADKKKAYGLSAFESKDTQKMVRDNHDLNHSGDIKCGVAIGLGALGAGLLVTGFVLAF